MDRVVLIVLEKVLVPELVSENDIVVVAEVVAVKDAVPEADDVAEVVAVDESVAEIEDVAVNVADEVPLNDTEVVRVVLTLVIPVEVTDVMADVVIVELGVECAVEDTVVEPVVVRELVIVDDGEVISQPKKVPLTWRSITSLAASAKSSHSSSELPVPESKTNFKSRHADFQASPGN